jgi:hypothetical protein
MVGRTGKVSGIDYISELVDLSENNLLEEDSELLASGRIELFGTQSSAFFIQFFVINSNGAYSWRWLARCSF